MAPHKVWTQSFGFGLHILNIIHVFLIVYVLCIVQSMSVITTSNHCFTPAGGRWVSLSRARPFSVSAIHRWTATIVFSQCGREGERGHMTKVSHCCKSDLSNTHTLCIPESAINKVRGFVGSDVMCGLPVLCTIISGLGTDRDMLYSTVQTSNWLGLWNTVLTVYDSCYHIWSTVISSFYVWAPLCQFWPQGGRQTLKQS